MLTQLSGRKALLGTMVRIAETSKLIALNSAGFLSGSASMLTPLCVINYNRPESSLVFVRC